MTLPQRIRLSRAKGWRLPENAVSVARPGPWGNPFIVGQHGDAARCVELHKMMLGGYFAVTDEEHMAKQRKAFTYVYAHFGELRGKPLACWCRIGQPCHADTLLELANR